MPVTRYTDMLEAAPVVATRSTMVMTTELHADKSLGRPCALRVTWSTSHGFRRYVVAYASVADIARLRPGVRYLLRKGTLERVREYFRAFERWAGPRAVVHA
jgi:hypothetical protein